MIPASSRPLTADRLLIVGGDAELRARVRDRYPQWEIGVAASALAGINDLCRYPSRAVIVSVDRASYRLKRQIAGLREAVGDQTPLILCCAPEAESLARESLSAGANDYLVCPLDGFELDRAVGYAHVDSLAKVDPDIDPSASMDELDRLGELVDGLADGGRGFLERIAGVVAAALAGAPVRVVVEGSIVEEGEVGTDPVMVEPIMCAGELLGQVSLGLRSGHPYQRADGEKLRHYAELIGRLLAAAGKQRRWRELAMTDELSQLPNRRYLDKFLADIITRAEVERSCVTFLLFDIDDFKRYNDTCGHDAGDEIIRVVGRLIRKHCREDDVVARYGGDEFAIVFWDAEQPRVAGSRHPDDAMDVLHRFTEALSAYEFESLAKCGPCQLTISGGLASFPWDGHTAGELVSRADQAMLQAKRAGKNRIVRIGQPAEPGA